MYTLTLVVFSIVAKLISGYGIGAPSKSCKHMTPGHFSTGVVSLPILSQKGTSPYSFNAEWDNKLKMVRVSVSGEPIAGFLIQGRLSEDGPAVGTFVNITETPDVKYQNCAALKFDPQSSVTHTDSADKRNLVFLWQPPKDMEKTENITFYGTLARSKDVFWLKQKSDTLNLSALDDDKAVTTTTTTATTPSEAATQNTTENVMSTTEPTSQGANTASVGNSLLSILLIITIKILMS